MAGMDLPIRAIREQVASAVDLIVHQTRFKDGSRRITHITEVERMEGDVITLQDIFIFDHSAGFDHEGRALGRLRATGLRPKFLDKMQYANVTRRPDALRLGPHLMARRSVLAVLDRARRACGPGRRLRAHAADEASITHAEPDRRRRPAAGVGARGQRGRPRQRQRDGRRRRGRRRGRPRRVHDGRSSAPRSWSSTPATRMRGERFEAAKDAALTFLDTVPEDVRVGVVTFADDVDRALEPTTDRDGGGSRHRRPHAQPGHPPLRRGPGRRRHGGDRGPAQPPRALRRPRHHRHACGRRHRRGVRERRARRRRVRRPRERRGLRSPAAGRRRRRCR